jgi:hypothetical protein
MAADKPTGNSKMNQAQIDQALFIEYMRYIDVGATEAEAVIEVANANELTCGDVYDALLREGLHNPCGQCEMYSY